MMTKMRLHPSSLFTVTAVLVFCSFVSAGQCAEVYTLCELSDVYILELDAASAPFVIRSPNFPDNYTSLASCSLVLQSGFEPLLLTFKYSVFNLEYEYDCTFDALCVGGVVFCGDWPTGNVFQYILPKNSTFTIVFTTDVDMQFAGFNIIVTSELALLGQVVFQPDGLGSDEYELRYIRSKHPSPVRYNDGCASTTENIVDF